MGAATTAPSMSANWVKSAEVSHMTVGQSFQ